MVTVEKKSIQTIHQLMPPELCMRRERWSVFCCSLFTLSISSRVPEDSLDSSVQFGRGLLV
jgi:hypothetical protein